MSGDPTANTPNVREVGRVDDIDAERVIDTSFMKLLSRFAEVRRTSVDRVELLVQRFLECVESVAVPTVSEFAKAVDERLDASAVITVDAYQKMVQRWDEHRIDQGNGAARADFFDLTMLRCMYHAVVPAFETRIERDVDEMTKRRFLRRLEEFLESDGGADEIVKSPLTSPAVRRSDTMDVVDGKNCHASARSSAATEGNRSPGMDDEDNDALAETVVPQRRGQLVKEEERQGVIEFRNVVNDGKRDSMIMLTGCKNIYQKQLPKMPREYIARLVYDRNHASMAIVKKGLRVVGGITYRIFPGRKFAEIVFCAITSTEQVKGYGSYLMNHLKNHVRQTSDVEYFLTYADNYATGYFKKQGFTADITLDRSVWASFIKDYEGGTIMQCHMLPVIDYLNVNEIVEEQKKVIYREVQNVANQTHSVFPGLQFTPGQKLDPRSIPGLVEAGWFPEMGRAVKQTDPLYPLLRQLLSDLQSQTWAWPFVEPVDPDTVPEYYNVIRDPVDLKSMDYRVETHYYKSFDSFKADFERMMDNCRIFNDSKSVYVKCANRLEAFFKSRLKAVEEYQTGLQQQQKQTENTTTAEAIPSK